jgi:hypothetical protein
MKPIVAALLLVLVSACNYSHVGLPMATFNRPPPPKGAGQLETQVAPLTLAIRRHVDTVVHGPDAEEDQLLVLRVRNFRVNERLTIPSDTASPEFSVTRFGPPSKGDMYKGYLIIRKITNDRVEAYLHLDVTASTPSGSYVQSAKFYGDYKFARSTDDVTEPTGGP